MPDSDYWSARRNPGATRRPADVRHPYERDKARIIHSAAFRRLQSKTQVLGVGEGDFHRTRLTHSMEVAQIGAGIVRQLEGRARNGELAAEAAELLDAQLMETICLAHDLGHPPFGHGGEIALNYMMRDAGGFEGNGQTLRLLGRLEAHTPGYGLDLSRRTLLGVLKYPVPYGRVAPPRPSPEAKPVSDDALLRVRADHWKPPKCFLDDEVPIVHWVTEGLPAGDRRGLGRVRRDPEVGSPGKTAEKAFDTSIMEIADDIAFGVHDLEDAVALDLIGREALQAEIGDLLDGAWARGRGLEGVLDDLFPTDGDEETASARRKQAIGSLVHAFLASVEVTEADAFETPLLRHRARLQPEAEALLEALKGFVGQEVIQAPVVQTLEYRGQQIVMRLFAALASDPGRLLKTGFARRWWEAPSEAAGLRVVCDYIAGMTDEYATRMYERLFMPRQGTVFERL
ncbi:anti-phage deoxyguanosine triphosphatase [Thiohalorhabdus sp.]|uniref:anti-phage deoxyguanosine triphosphatase n=1 Tax=Thiohalorhabdus sp. TaxID=3094134 RepID=UPI002FC2800B